MTTRQDIFRLMQEVDNVPKNRQASLAASLMAAGLMRTNWLLSTCVRVVMWRRKISAYNSWMYFFTKLPEAATSILVEFKKHMVEGKDTYDAKSAGGYSDPEVKQIIEIMRLHGWTEPVEV